MNTQEIVKNGAKQIPALDAMCHMFALRERTRSNIQIASLKQKMHKEGFAFSREDYEKALKVLSDAKLGELVLNRRGRIVGLKGIKYTLQSIGKLIGEDATPQFAKYRARFTQHPEAIEIHLPEFLEMPRPIQKDLDLIVYMDGKPVTVGLSKDLSSNTITKLIDKLRSA